MVVFCSTFLSKVSVFFIRSLGCIVSVSSLKFIIIGAPKILCLDSECAGRSFMRCSAVSSIFWRFAQSLQYSEEAVLSLLEFLLSSLCHCGDVQLTRCKVILC